MQGFGYEGTGVRNMKLRRKLFSSKDPYDCSRQELFLAACKENYDHLITHCDDYKKISECLGVHSSDDIKSTADIPVLTTMLMKQHDFRAGPYLIIASSSGTSGHASHIPFELSSLWSGLKMCIRITKFYGLISPKPCRYIVMGYRPHHSNTTAVTKTAYLTTMLTPAISRKYILKHTKDGYVPDFDGIIEALRKYEKKKAPVRFMGFPSYTFFLFQILDERGLYFKLPKGSKIMLGGGWKQFYREAADKETFYRMAKKTLGVDEENIVEFFGAVEHPILYTSCPGHHFHVPVYSNIIIRDPDTLEPLEHGKTGLVNLISPLCKAAPILSVMTDDLGILHDGSECTCGLDAPFLEIIGRVAPENIKTCAAGAADILKGVKV